MKLLMNAIDYQDQLNVFHKEQSDNFDDCIEFAWCITPYIYMYILSHHWRTRHLQHRD